MFAAGKVGSKVRTTYRLGPPISSLCVHYMCSGYSLGRGAIPLGHTYCWAAFCRLSACEASMKMPTKRCASLPAVIGWSHKVCSIAFLGLHKRHDLCPYRYQVMGCFWSQAETRTRAAESRQQHTSAMVHKTRVKYSITAKQELNSLTRLKSYWSPVADPGGTGGMCFPIEHPYKCADTPSCVISYMQ